jgi:hypothetical protein
MLQYNLLLKFFVFFCILNAKVGFCQMLGGSNVNQIMQSQQQHYRSVNPTPPPTQADIQAGQERQRAGKPAELSHSEKMQRHVDNLLQEAYVLNHKIQETHYYNSPQYIQDVPNYTNAITLIKEMLEDKRALSIKDVYYNAEAAYGNLHLSNPEYENLIRSNADFIKTWLVQSKYDVNDPEALHYGIQKFMSDTLYIFKKGKRSGHMPYFYDYIDVNASKDRRNYFVTKTLATGTGQCHTFPVAYLILAEALGVDAFLAYNPRHSFIRYKNNQGAIINYETTVDRFLADAFYLQTLPVMATAKRNKLYITSLTKKQVIASVLYDLGVNFLEEHWIGDKKLITECLALARPHFPGQQYINNSECHLQKRLYAYDLNQMVKTRQIKNVSEIEKHPDIVAAYDNYMAYMQRITTLGIQDFPKDEELRMMEYADEKGRLQQAKGINSKQKRTLFIR